MAELTFEPPGPGAWMLDKTHFNGPVSRYYQVTCPSSQLEGFQQGAEHHGYLFDRELTFVNEFRYHRFRPLVGSPSAGPEAETTFQRRVQRLAETYATKRWREDLDRWDNEWKPAQHKVNRSLQAINLTDLDDDKLLDHLENCRQALQDSESLHVRMSFCWGIPQYDFLRFTSKWTSHPPREVLSLLDGASPESAGAVEEFQRVVRTIRETPSARQIARSGEDPAVIINRLREADSPVGPAVNDWLDAVGYRLVSGWDLAEPYVLEYPKTLVQSLRKALDGRSDGPVDHSSTTRFAAVRQEVPDKRRDRFDELYNEARLTYRVRDERNFLSGPSRGLMRRALLEVGRRLTERDRLRAPNHAVDFTHDELVSVFTGEGGPSAEEIAARVEFRQTHDNSDAPDQLGSDVADPYEGRDLPDSARRFMSGVRAYRRANYPDTPPTSPHETTIQGLGASSGSVEGRARVVSNPEDSLDITDGDILVTGTMSPGYNVTLPLIGGIVTDTGGTLSHPAIVAREYGIPAVVGCEDATDRINDGDRIVVNGDEGTVQLL